jgi:hypothetical protein
VTLHISYTGQAPPLVTPTRLSYRPRVSHKRSGGERERMRACISLWQNERTRVLALLKQGRHCNPLFADRRIVVNNVVVIFLAGLARRMAATVRSSVSLRFSPRREPTNQVRPTVSVGWWPPCRTKGRQHIRSRSEQLGRVSTKAGGNPQMVSKPRAAKNIPRIWSSCKGIYVQQKPTGMYK